MVGMPVDDWNGSKQIREDLQRHHLENSKRQETLLYWTAIVVAIVALH
jgi:hypothetical protein